VLTDYEEDQLAEETVMCLKGLGFDYFRYYPNYERALHGFGQYYNARTRGKSEKELSNAQVIEMFKRDCTAIGQSAGIITPDKVK
jgi:hypothetical protein